MLLEFITAAEILQLDLNIICEKFLSTATVKKNPDFIYVNSPG